jgi:hypothetical protein
MAGKYTKNIYIQRPIEFYQNLDFGKQIPIPSGNPDFIGSFHSEIEMQFEAYMHKCWGGKKVQPGKYTQSSSNEIILKYRLRVGKKTCRGVSESSPKPKSSTVRHTSHLKK